MELIKSTEYEWREKWKDKEITAAEAIDKIITGNRVFIDSGCAEPQLLTSELIKNSEKLIDSEILHFLTIGPEKYFKDKAEDLFRHNAFFIGKTLREEINRGQADYTPIYASEIASLFLTGRKHIDIALIQVSPPDPYGFCSLGINVDIVKPLAQSSHLTIAEINPQMPRTLGNSFIHMKEIDFFVYNNTPLLEFHFDEPDEIADKIGRNLVNLIENKSTIHIGFGDLPNAMLNYLTSKKNLGMHSHYVTDNIISLIEGGILTGRRKNFHPEKIITSYALGTKRLYDFVDNNPYIEFHPSDYVCNPRNIGMNKQMVSINSARQIDLTGQVNAATEGYQFYSGLGETIDFMRGAAFSKRGKPIIIMPSTSRDGLKSRVVPHLDEGAGVMLSRGDVHYVVTEWGVAYLHGKTIRERVLELICIAHPDFRQSLLEEAKKLNYIFSDQLLPCDGEGRICLYPSEYETIYKVRNNKKIKVRPVKTTDEPLLKDLYYTLNETDRYLRFFEVRKEFTHSKTQGEVNIDYDKIFSIGAFIGEIGREKMIGNATYYLNPTSNMAEYSFIVSEKWRGEGIGTYLYQHLIIIAKEKGIKGFYGTIHIQNKSTVHIIQQGGYTKITPPEQGEKELFYEVFFDRENSNE
ncbi:MAG: GNAT family N-acetyltransferase [Promethearchaeota archaeon]